VTPLTLKSVDDLFTLWRIVGPESVRLGVQDATAEQRRQIVAAFSAAATPVSDPADGEAGGQTLRQVEATLAAFACLVAATDNDYLIRVHDRLQNDIARIFALIVSEADVSMPDPPADSEWIGLIEACDGDAAAARVRDYVGDLHARVLRILTRWPSVVASEITSVRG